MANPEFPEFPREEYESRRTRTRELMMNAKLDALLLTSENNYRYLTGHTSQRFVNKSRVMLAVLGPKDDPILIIPESERGVAEQTAWTNDIRTYAGPPERLGFFHAWGNVVSETLGSLRITRGRVGIELGSQQRLGMSVEDYNNLRGRLPGIEFVDSSEILFNVRARKSAREMECLRKAAEITGQAFDVCVSVIRVGITERDVFRLMVTTMIELGAEKPGYIPVLFHNPNEAPTARRLFIGGPTDRVLKAGDVVDIDAGCIYKGYWADFNRMFCMGEPPKRIRDAYRTINESIREMIGRIKPGLRVSEISRLFASGFEKAQLPESGIGRMGHGLGLDMPEPPSIGDRDDYIIEPGSTLCIEPSFFVPSYGIMIGEEEIIATNSGCEVISKMASPEVMVL